MGSGKKGEMEVLSALPKHSWLQQARRTSEQFAGYWEQLVGDCKSVRHAQNHQKDSQNSKLLCSWSQLIGDPGTSQPKQGLRVQAAKRLQLSQDPLLSCCPCGTVHMELCQPGTFT